jgi:hypothetical protein
MAPRKSVRLKRVCENLVSVPQGRLNLAQDASPGYIMQHVSVPQGRLNLAQDASPGYIMQHVSVPQGRLNFTLVQIRFLQEAESLLG